MEKEEYKILLEEISKENKLSVDELATILNNYYNNQKSTYNSKFFINYEDLDCVDYGFDRDSIKARINCILKKYNSWRLKNESKNNMTFEI